jgi:2-dehydro-3-deoxygalactonokinase
LTTAGLLASVVEGEAEDGDAFAAGLALGRERTLGLGTLLFGVRARVIRGELQRSDAASFTRGLLIGSEIADALALYPEIAGATVPLIGSEAACRLYAAALRRCGVTGVQVDSAQACVEGYRLLNSHRLRAFAATGRGGQSDMAAIGRQSR